MLSDYAAVSKLETLLLAASPGITAGYSLAKSGMSSLDFYRKNRQAIMQDIAKKTAEKAFNVSKNIEESIEEIAQKTGSEIEEIIENIVEYIPQNVTDSDNRLDLRPSLSLLFLFLLASEKALLLGSGFFLDGSVRIELVALGNCLDCAL